MQLLIFLDFLTWNDEAIITKLHEEVMELRGEVENFASFLRVSCTRYLAQREARPVPLITAHSSGKAQSRVASVP